MQQTESTNRRSDGAASGNDARAIMNAGASAPASMPNHKYHRPYPAKPRPGEIVGGGYFIFRRGDGTGRVRPSMWPYEHGSAETARAEAERLSRAFPGYRFDVFELAGSFAQVPA